MDIYIDLETTGTNAHTCEIVEIYAEYDTSNFHRLIKPEVWSYEAQAVHGLQQDECNANIKDALRDFCMWLPRSKFNFICYANPNVFESGTSNQGYYVFDIAVLKMAFYRLGQDSYYWFINNVKYHVINVYEIIKDLHKQGVFDISKCEDLTQFSQENVARSFGIYYNSHRATEDVMALRKIYDYCLRATSNSTADVGEGDGNPQGTLKLC